MSIKVPLKDPFSIKNIIKYHKREREKERENLLSRMLYVYEKRHDVRICRNTRVWFGITLAARNAEEIMRRKRTSPLKLERPLDMEKFDGRCLRIIEGKPPERRYCATIRACGGEVGRLGA